MHVLSWNFTILRLCGLWRPVEWSSGWRKNLYSIYTCFTVFVTFSFTFSEFIEFVTSVNDVGEFANNSLMLLSTLGVCYKIANFVYKREEIVELVEMLRNEICKPQGVKEIAIQKRFDARCRHNTLLFGGLAESAVIAITVGSFVGNVPERTLPFKGWVPFDYKTHHGFWIAFIHQILGHAMAATVGSMCDTLFYGLMAQTCGQLNILKSRFRAMPHVIQAQKSNESSVEAVEREEMKKCVRHHHEILRFAEWANDIFSLVIFIQFSVSTIVICVSTYMLSHTHFLSAEFTFILVYLVNMITQIFLLCWNGNEVIVESLDVGTAVYEMDWGWLKQNTKNDLRIIMTRSLEPVRYTSGHVLTLSLDSYNKLMKLSYSVYNLLQQSSS